MCPDKVPIKIWGVIVKVAGTIVSDPTLDTIVTLYNPLGKTGVLNQVLTVPPVNVVLPKTVYPPNVTV